MSHSIREQSVIFIDEWLVWQQGFLDQLLIAWNHSLAESDEQRQRHLIEQVMCHYQQYFHEKSKTSEEDIFIIFSPSWLSSFEKALLWLAGFKPSTILRVVNGAVREDLTAEQAAALEVLKSETRRMEREISDTMARVQESVADAPLLATTRRVGRLIDGQIRTLDDAMETMKTTMLSVVENTGGLRGSTVRKLVEVLGTNQTVKVLAAVAEFQVRIQSSGLQRDSQYQSS